MGLTDFDQILKKQNGQVMDQIKKDMMNAFIKTYGVQRITFRAEHVEPKNGAQKSSAIHDPVINGKNYDESSDYRALGHAAAERAERQLIDHPGDHEEKIYVGRNLKGTRDFIAEHDPRPQFHDSKTGENFTRVYSKRDDPKGKNDPLKGTGYRTVGVAIAKRRFEWGQIRQSDVVAIHSSGLDGWVSYPPTGGNEVVVRFQNEGNVDPR